MGLSMQNTGSYTGGFLTGTLLSIGSLVVLLLVMRSWTRTWVGEGGRALDEGESPAMAMQRAIVAEVPQPASLVAGGVNG